MVILSFLMPEFSPAFAKRSDDLYKIQFLQDGYPGKKMKDGVFPHPIYGTFVLRDYITQFEENGKDMYKKAIITVADASINRMEEFLGTSVFWYPTDSPFNNYNQKYYSGLTQSHYAQLISKVYEITSIAKYRDAAVKIYKSLKIPVENKGVFHLSTNGPSVQELAMAPNGYILNGWLSIISNLRKVAISLNYHEATVFWEENLSALTKMLHLFDMPELSNSRYTLNGSAVIKLRASVKNIEIKLASLEVPKDGKYNVPIPEVKHVWSSYIDPRWVKNRGNRIFIKRNEAILNLLLSRYSYPQENQLYLTLVSPEDTTLSIEIQHGEYLPTSNRQQKAKFTLIKQIPVKKGTNNIKLQIPWKYAGLVGHPTTFKQIGNRYYNIYHFIHIAKLEELYETTGEKLFKDYAEKWKGYTNNWAKLAVYNGMEIKPYEFARLR